MGGGPEQDKGARRCPANTGGVKTGASVCWYPFDSHQHRAGKKKITRTKKQTSNKSQFRNPKFQFISLRPGLEVGYCDLAFI
jgi:hypothetical protein